MQEETNSIVYQRTQNPWRKMSIYTLHLLPKHMKQIRNFTLYSPCILTSTFNFFNHLFFILIFFYFLFHFFSFFGSRNWKITNCHALQVYVVVETVDNLGVWLVSVCVCVWCPSLLCGFASRSLLEVWSCLYDTHEAETLGSNWYSALSGGFTRTSPFNKDKKTGNWESYKMTLPNYHKEITILGGGTTFGGLRMYQTEPA
jgi:hypothetical protein